MRAQILVFCVVSFVSTAALAANAPQQIVCLHVEPGTITVDGMLDDWGEATGVTVAAPDAAAAGFNLRCAYDAQKLYLSVDVSDNRLIRSRDRKEDDHLVFHFGAGKTTLTVFPASGNIPHYMVWSDGKRRGLTLIDSLQPRGWSVELGMPLADVPEWRAHLAAVPLDLEFQHVDEASESTKRGGMIHAVTRLMFEDADASYQKFLGDLGLASTPVRLDAMIDLGDGPRRLIWAGKVVGVLSDGYAYIELPVDNPRDVLEVRAVPYAGAKSMILARTVEHGNGGSREILAFFRLDGTRFTRVFAHEMQKQIGERKLVNGWKLVPGSKKGTLDLVVTPGAAVGWTADTFHEATADDLVPIMLPWGEKKQEIWHLDASGVSGG